MQVLSHFRPDSAPHRAKVTLAPLAVAHGQLMFTKAQLIVYRKELLVRLKHYRYSHRRIGLMWVAFLTQRPPIAF